MLEPQGFVEAVRQVARGGSVLDPEVVAHMLDRRIRRADRRSRARASSTCSPRWRRASPTRAIAAALGIGEHTLQRHIGSIFAKLELPVSGDEHRRVLAVLSYLRAQED